MSVLRTSIRPGAINAVTRFQRAPLQAIRFETNSAASSSSTLTSTVNPLTWPEYLTLRHRRRVLAQLFSIPGALGGLIGGGAYFGSLEADPTQPIFGVEPMFVYAGAT
jgi:import inner membrane translocase subunit TIM23